MLRSTIDWTRVGRAVAYYQQQGFKYIEVPWRVDDSVFKVTAPTDATPFRCKFDDVARPDILVGSAEQGFVAIMPTLEPGMYVSVSPCFRDKEIAELHFSDFVKVELCVIAPSDLTASCGILGAHAMSFAHGEGLQQLCYLDVSEGFDLMAGTIEIGSYGSRTAAIDNKHLVWAYYTLD